MLFFLHRKSTLTKIIAFHSLEMEVYFPIVSSAFDPFLAFQLHSIDLICRGREQPASSRFIVKGFVVCVLTFLEPTMLHQLTNIQCWLSALRFSKRTSICAQFLLFAVHRGCAVLLLAYSLKSSLVCTKCFRGLPWRLWLHRDRVWRWA